MTNTNNLQARGRMPRSRATLLLIIAVVSVCTAATSFARHHRARVSRDAEPGRFDYYLLTLSWSPTYCLTHANDQTQCSGKGFGFVLHGLWPQYNSGGYPENCSTDTQLPAAALAVGQTLYPSPALMRHEWQAHGTCSGVDAKTYFQTEDRALAAVRIPAVFEAPRVVQSMTAAQIETSFHNANPALPANSLVVACSRGELSEVRVCLTRDLQPRACGTGVRSSCPAAAAVGIPSTR